MDFVAQPAGLASLVREIICLSYEHGYFRDSLQMVKTMPPKRTMEKKKKQKQKQEKANSARRYMVEEGKIDRQR